MFRWFRRRPEPPPPKPDADFDQAWADYVAWSDMDEDHLPDHLRPGDE